MLLSRRQSAIAGGCALIGAGLLSSVSAVAAATEESAVEQASEALRKAMLSASKAQLDALTATKLVYVHSDGHVEDKATYVDTIATKKTVYTTITLSNVKTFVSGDVAVMRLIFDCVSQDQGQPVATSHLGIMQTWQKQGGHWKLLARQAYHI
jgi:ketosteroid isomerase-like protein